MLIHILPRRYVSRDNEKNRSNSWPASLHRPAMAPSNLQGLNIIHSPPPAADSQDLIGQPYPDLAVQLDLWSNLTFDSDEARDDHSRQKSVDDEEDTHSPPLGTSEAAIRDGHINVVTGTSLGTNQQHLSRQVQHQQLPLDFNSILAAIGIDPYSSPQQNAALAPSLAQLLALQGSNLAHPATAPVVMPIQQQQSGATENQAQANDADDLYPPAKRARSRRASDIMAVASTEGSISPEQVSVVAAEDKRRRNTAASARFRMKKKEREAALEGKAKELEIRVGELERECEALRRENGWLKGLVIGVTGAAQAPVVSTTTAKRSRDEAGGT